MMRFQIPAVTVTRSGSIQYMNRPNTGLAKFSTMVFPILLRPWISLSLERSQGAPSPRRYYHSNFNVYYEIGFCIGAGKPVVPTLDFTMKDANANVSLTGLFATTGQLRYQSYRDLSSKIERINLSNYRPIVPKLKNHNQPLFFLSALKRTNFIEYISTAIGNSQVEARVFDPNDMISMSINDAFSDVSASTGLILPLVAATIEGDLKHNLQASVLAGMAHGLGIEPLIIQFDDNPAPVDFREFISTARGRIETTKDVDVEAYCQQTLVLSQRSKPLGRNRTPSLLEQIDLGKSAAEHEALKLDQYFVRTAQFTRACHHAKTLRSQRLLNILFFLEKRAALLCSRY